MRKKNQHVKKITDSNYIDIPEDSTNEKVQQIDLLYKCISKLKEADRVLITLVLDEKPYEQIAEITGNTENNLRVKIQRIKKELTEKLEEFATYYDSLEEVFENKEQIEVSKFYEKLPKPTSIAIEEWLNDDVYFRKTEDRTK